MAYGPISIAFAKNDELVAEYTLKSSYEFSENLILEINDLAHKSEFKLHDLEVIGVTIGPGSYTSLRIAVTLAKTLGQLLSIPVVPVSTLEGLASQFKYLDSVIFTAISARRNEFNLAMFSVKQNQLQRLTPDFSLDTEKLLKKLELIQGKFYLIGEISSEIIKRANFNKDLQIIPSHLRAETIANIANTKKMDIIPADSVFPLYSHTPNIGKIKKRVTT